MKGDIVKRCSSMFVVLCSRNYVAFVESYEEAKKLAGRYKDGMCKKIVQKEEQAYWINIVKNIPPIKKDAIPIYASGEQRMCHEFHTTPYPYFKKNQNLLIYFPI